MSTGHQLEREVKSILIKKGCLESNIMDNFYYQDPMTGKPREKDIIAKFPQDVRDAWGDSIVFSYNITLMIECKNLPSKPKVFLRLVGDAGNLLRDSVLAFGISQQFLDLDIIFRNNKHHYCFYTHLIDHWKISGEDFLHSAQNQSLNSFKVYKESNNIGSDIVYLIVVYKGDIEFIDERGNKRSMPDAPFLVRSIDDVYGLPNRKCLIEFVQFDALEDKIDRIMDKDRTNINENISVGTTMIPTQPRRPVNRGR